MGGESDSFLLKESTTHSQEWGDVPPFVTLGKVSILPTAFGRVVWVVESLRRGPWGGRSGPDKINNGTKKCSEWMAVHPPGRSQCRVSGVGVRGLYRANQMEHGSGSALLRRPKFPLGEGVMGVLGLIPRKSKYR